MNKSFLKSDIDKIVSLYVYGARTINDIAREYRVDRRTVRSALISQDIALRGVAKYLAAFVPRFSYEVDAEAFQEPLSESSKYWLGFLLADGSIGRGCVAISLNQRDEEHLRKFRMFMRSDSPIRLRSKGCSIVIIHSAKVCLDLAAFGVVPRKSLTATVDIRVTNSRDFWRGMIDGDGYVSKRRSILHLVGTESVIRSWGEYAAQFGPHPTIRRHSIGTVYNSWSTGSSARKLFHILYKNAPYGARLDRKYWGAMEY